MINYMTTVRKNDIETEDFGKELLGDDSILKTNPQAEENPAVNKGKKKIIKNAASKASVKQPEPVSPTIKNKYKSLATLSDDDLGDEDGSDD